MLAYIKDGFSNPSMWEPVDYVCIKQGVGESIGYANGKPCRVRNDAVEFVPPSSSFRKPLWAEGDVAWWTEDGEWVC